MVWSASKRNLLVLAGLCLATAAPARAAEPCSVGAGQARAEAAKLAEMPFFNESGIAWCADAIPALVTMLGDSEWRVRNQAAGALRDATASAALVPAAASHLAAIAAATKRMAASTVMSDWGAAVILHEVMGRIGKDAVPHLAEGLAWAKVRSSAAQSLGLMGAPAKAALPALRAALKEEKDPATAGTLRSAIAAIGGQ